METFPCLIPRAPAETSDAARVIAQSVRQSDGILYRGRTGQGVGYELDAERNQVHVLRTNNAVYVRSLVGVQFFIRKMNRVIFAIVLPGSLARKGTRLRAPTLYFSPRPQKGHALKSYWHRKIETTDTRFFLPFFSPLKTDSGRDSHMHGTPKAEQKGENTSCGIELH